MDDCEYDPNAEASHWAPGADEEREKRGDKPPRGREEKKPKKTKHERACPEFEDVPGYEGAPFIGCVEFAPPMPMPPPPTEPPERQFDGSTSLSEDECRAAFRKFVESQACYGKKPMEEMTITSCTSVAAFHYKLETFCENRTTKKKKKPYKGGSVDGPENGPAPMPWEIACAPKDMFHEDKVKKEVPHTAKVKKCKDCKGRGWETCDECDGWGKVECWVCEGEGKGQLTDDEGNPQDCMHCDGTGEKRCLECGGDGRTVCDDCEGYKKLRCFIRLKVKFINHKDEYVLERTDLPDEVISKSGGVDLFNEAYPRVYPVQNFPVPEINQHSFGLVQAHAGKWPNEFIHMQRQTIRCVPVTEVAYKWEESNYRFWVYGTERNVYAPDYPQQTCCGCTVL